MTDTRQFLVTMSARSDEKLSTDMMANRIAGVLLACPSVFADGMVERTMTVVPLPSLSADDSDLQIGFRKLAAFARSTGSGETIGVFRTEAAALVAELSKEHPARTGHVDQAALDAVRAIRASDKASDRQVQKDARAQLIITDAICRCMPERSDA